MKYDNILMIFLSLVILFQFLSLIPFVDAGRLWATATESSGGTTFTVSWAQGCTTTSLSSLGPNACHSEKPWFCPVGSQGGNEYVQRSGICGCDANSKPDSLGITCDECVFPCLNNGGCEDYERCVTWGDWCDNNKDCVCNIFTEAEGCSYFSTCSGGQTCEYTGGDRCDARNYRCVSSGPPCSCSGVHTCWWEKDDGSGDDCVPRSQSTSCEVMVVVPMSSANPYLDCEVANAYYYCDYPPPGCKLKSVSYCSGSPKGDCCTAKQYLDGDCPWP